MAPIWSAEYVVTEAQARQLIETQFPELAPVIVRPLGEGFDNTVYQVNDHYVFRFPRREVAVDLLKTENQLLPRLVHRLPLAIPEPLFVGQSDSNYPWPFTGYRLVPGESIGFLSESQRLLSISALAQTLRNLHDTPVQMARECGVPDDQLNRLDIALRKPKLLANVERVVELGLCDVPEMLRDYAESLSCFPYENKEALVHGDLHVRNLLVDAQGCVSGIIDWGDTHIGHPAVDLSIVYSFFPPSGRKRFFEYYGEVDVATQKLARFKAVYTSVLLLLYAHDRKDLQQITAARDSLRLALMNKVDERV
jgi:aminoglycoside phosphotransferase (APT) family kinase protein